MVITGVNPDSGEKYLAKADNISSDFIESMSDFEMSEEQIKRMIDSLNISADAKALLYSMTKVTIKIGEYILKIGKKIIDYICTLFKEYPKASFGMIFGAIAGILISTIPVIGFVLGSIVTHVLMLFGLVGGLMEDLKDDGLERKIAEINATFSSLKRA